MGYIMNNFNEVWKSYLNEKKDFSLLLEAKVKDVKAKYKNLTESGWIDWARGQIEDVLGPKGVSKYLLFWAREMENQFKDEEPEDLKGSDDVLEIGNVVLDLVMQFHKNQPRLEEKDIYKYTIDRLQREMEAIGLSSKEKRKKKKEEAVEGSEIVYDDNDIFAVRPYKEKASCYYGMRTRWCISATESKNYFNDYTKDGKAFVMLRMENLPDSDTNKKIALVFDRDGDFDEAYDAPDDSMGYVEVRDAIALNHKRTGMNPYDELDSEEQQEIDEILQELMAASASNVVDNPPDATEGYEEKIEQLEEEYNAILKHAYFSAEVEWDGNSNYMYFSGGFNIEIDNSKFEDGEYEMPSGWQAERVLTGKIDSLMQDIGVYVEDVEISDYSGVTTFELRMATSDYEANPDGYEEFLENLREYEGKYDAMLRVIEKHLAEEEYSEYEMPSGWQAERVLTGKVDSLMQDIGVYVEDVEISDYSGVTTFELRMATSDYEANPDGYEEFLENLREYEGKYDAMLRVIEKHLAEEEYIGPIEFDRFREEDLEKFGESLKNFTYHSEEDIGDETIAFESEVSVLPGNRGALDTLKLIPGVQSFQPYTTSGAGMQKFNSKELNDMVVLRLKALHQKVVKYLQKQLELPIPNLPPKVIKELTIPEMFNIVLLMPRGSKVERNSQGLAFMVDLEIDDVKVTPEVVKAVMDVIEFVDSNFELVRSTVIDVVNELYESSVQKGGERMEHLSDLSKQIISLAMRSKDKDRRLIQTVQEIEDYQFQKSTEERKNKATYLTSVLSKALVVLQELGIVPESEFMSDAKLYKPEHAKKYFPDTRPGWSAVDAPAMELQESNIIQSEINKYLNHTADSFNQEDINVYFKLKEEKDRSRQRGIYKFYTMIGYTIDNASRRGLDDMLAEIRALPNVTIVTVVVANRRIGENRYVAGLSVKLIPSYPGVFSSPEDTKARILRDIRRVKGVQKIFKVSTSLERIE